MNLTKLKELKGAVNHCLLSYVENFVDSSIQHDSKENDDWIWAFDDDLHTLDFSIRGTDDLADVLKDISIYPRKIKGVGYACAGFLEGAEKILDYALPQFLNASQNGFKITLSGHSYGGAIAQIMQQILRVEHGIKTDCISFGSPRVWFPFAKVKGRHLRVQIETDPITYLPFITGHIFRIYKHRQSENIELHNSGWWMKAEDHYLTTYKTIIEGQYAKQHQQFGSFQATHRSEDNARTVLSKRTVHGLFTRGYNKT